MASEEPIAKGARQTSGRLGAGAMGDAETLDVKGLQALAANRNLPVLGRVLGRAEGAADPSPGGPERRITGEREARSETLPGAKKKVKLNPARLALVLVRAPVGFVGTLILHYGGVVLPNVLYGINAQQI